MSWLFSRVEKAAFHDKAWKRAEQAALDERWQGLSLPARRHLLDGVRAVSPTATSAPINPVANFPAGVVAEWRSAGLISLEEAGRPGHFILAAGAGARRHPQDDVRAQPGRRGLPW